MNKTLHTKTMVERLEVVKNSNNIYCALLYGSFNACFAPLNNNTEKKKTGQQTFKITRANFEQRVCQTFFPKLMSGLICIMHRN